MQRDITTLLDKEATAGCFFQLAHEISRHKQTNKKYTKQKETKKHDTRVRSCDSESVNLLRAGTGWVTVSSEEVAIIGEGFAPNRVQ